MSAAHSPRADGAQAGLTAGAPVSGVGGDTGPAGALGGALTALRPHLACFITGTDTEIGKTFVSCALLHVLRARGWSALGMKPVAAGTGFGPDGSLNEDVQALMAASSVQAPVAQVAPYVLRTPAAPHIAAALDGVAIKRAPILAALAQLRAQADAVLVEGVGGFCVPLGEGWDTADLAQELALPVVLVVGLRLGCINHALLSAQAIAARGLRLAGWVANTVDASMAYRDENIQALNARLGAPLLGVLPRLAEPDPAQVAHHLDLEPLLASCRA